jgi:hypothetical protein
VQEEQKQAQEAQEKLKKATEDAKRAAREAKEKPVKKVAKSKSRTREDELTVVGNKLKQEPVKNEEPAKHEELKEEMEDVRASQESIEPDEAQPGSSQEVAAS